MFERAKTTGWPAALMSPGLGFAEASSFTSLRQPPGGLGLHHGWHAAALVLPRWCRLRRRGVPRSEV